MISRLLEPVQHWTALAASACRFFKRKLPAPSAHAAYQRWLRNYEPTPLQLQRQRQTTFAWTPLISLATTTLQTSPRRLEEFLLSLTDQTYARWELCIVHDGSQHEIDSVVTEYARRDPRIRLRRSSTTAEPTALGNMALEMAGGSFVTLLDSQDKLAPFALYALVSALNQTPDADVLYTDEDEFSEANNLRHDPHFKPNWSPDTLRSHNYIGRLAFLRRTLLAQIGGLRQGLEGAHDYDLMLRATEKTQRIVHIPQVLYHRCALEEATPNHAACCRALDDHLQRLGRPGSVEPTSDAGVFHIRHDVTARPPVSILIPTRDQAALLEQCIASLAKTSYAHVEIILVENHSVQSATFALYSRLARQPNLRVLTWTDPFNYARVNNFAAAHACGDVLVFLNNDIEVINAAWLEEMLGHALREEVGAVGAKLYYPNGRVQHAGVILGLNGVAGHAQRGHRRASTGYMHRLSATQNVFAVTGACMMMRKALFEELGGFDDRFTLAFNDVDLCLRIRQRGLQVVWTPFAEMVHHESRTRGLDLWPAARRRLQREAALFRRKWGATLMAGDPYYNPNFTLDGEDFRPRV